MNKTIYNNNNKGVSFNFIVNLKKKGFINISFRFSANIMVAKRFNDIFSTFTPIHTPICTLKTLKKKLQLLSGIELHPQR